MPAPRPTTADERRTFRRLGASGCCVIPNPWDVGSARYLQSVGFKALATTRLVGSASELTLQGIAALCVRRVSVGGALARAAWAGFINAAKLIAEQGRFDGLANAARGQELDALFRADLQQREAR